MKMQTPAVLTMTKPVDSSRALLMLDAVALEAAAPQATTLTTAIWTRFATYGMPSGNPIANPGGEKCHHRRPKELCS